MPNFENELAPPIDRRNMYSTATAKNGDDCVAYVNPADEVLAVYKRERANLESALREAENIYHTAQNALNEFLSATSVIGEEGRPTTAVMR